MSNVPSGYVLDASALIALFYGEPGGQIVQELLAERCIINIVNYAEVLTRLATNGEDATSFINN